ncbi:endolytic transglycosylase MltG [Vibrio aestuarianus]|uniref:Endolytic murein transglycosylase n=1 Tax=Vibrio aestuarianus TaxID=28171 RepID=A0ABD7YIK0_9VIBR|nr:endolytic transglycosylase MltG [Vibrio aestuarianus]WGK84491.1 endolytic transglycosylase MltG [Vibrio aestuarianus]
MIKKLTLLLLLVIAITSAGYFYIKQKVDGYLHQAVAIHSSEIITIPSGTSLNGVLTILSEKNWIADSPLSKLVRRLHPELTKIKAGTYQILASEALIDVLNKAVDGKEHQFAITFVEGSRFNEWRALLAQTQGLTSTLNALSEAEIAKQLGIDRDKLEGLFLAETYHFTFGTTDLEILQRAHAKLQTLLDKYWASRQAGLPLKTPYEALILASIIEKETAIASERERIASVFVNRLNKRMRLQTDPTVIYGMGDSYDGNIRKKDLRTPTPYNTYTISGLPPTPIAMAGEDSIKAALNPEQSNYLYFVASGTGGHVFSKTLTEHNRAVRAYLKQLRK